jgi:hypothetical protein
MLSSFMVNDMPDPPIAFQSSRRIISWSRSSRQNKASVCRRLWRMRSPALGTGKCSSNRSTRASSSVQLEHLLNEAVRRFGVGILCGYPHVGFQDEADNYYFSAISAEHSDANLH